MKLLNLENSGLTQTNTVELKNIQEELAGKVILEGEIFPEEVQLIAGCDVSITPDKQNMVGVISLFSWPDLEIVKIVHAYKAADFHYIPGLLSFRELPVLLKAVQLLDQTPDIVLVDGHGYSHPRRFGLACHLGVITGWRTIGCGKSKFIGTFQEPGGQKGSASDLISDDEIIGKVVRTRSGVKPLWISSGHQISLDSAVKWVLKTVTKYRLPEPVRASHNAASIYRKKFSQESFSK